MPPLSRPAARARRRPPLQDGGPRSQFTRRSSSAAGQHWPRALVVTGIMACWLTGCGRPDQETIFRQAGIARLSFPGDSPEDEFRRVAATIRETKNRFHGRRQSAELQAELARPDLDRGTRCQLLAERALDLQRLGETDKAIDSIDEALALARSEPADTLLVGQLSRVEAIVCLRQAEEQNCLAGHCAQSCIFPVERGGVHRRRAAAERAREACLRYLEQGRPPSTAESLWLLNILAMTLGEYPQGVPERYRIPPHALAGADDLPEFVDVAPQLGVHRLGIAGGVIAEDLDRDGLLDLVATSAAPDDPLHLYHNQGDGSFRDQTEAAGLTGQRGGLHCQAVDYNNDGWPDIHVARGGWFLREGCIRKSLLHNNGDGTFRDVTRAAGLADPAYPSQAGVWADLDNDGDLDLYQANESLVEAAAELNFPAQLYRNNGDGTFTEIATAAGVTNDRYAKGAAAGDYDNDGDLDLYVSNFHYFDDPAAGRNRLYRNEGDGTFTDVAEELHVTQPLRSFATWWFDYDHDGWLDLFVAAYEAVLSDVVGNYLPGPRRDCRLRLYHNERGQAFRDVAEELGLDGAYQAMGASFGDLDGDGWLDLYLGTGGQYYDWLVPNVAFRNREGQAFADVTSATRLGHLQKGHSVTFADLDNDGDQDLYHSLGGFYPGDRYTNALFLNPGSGHRYLKLRLVGRRTNRAAIGVRIRVDVVGPTGSRSIYRCHGLGSSFGGQPSREEIGLGDAERIERLELDWPTSGTRQTFADVPLDRWLEIEEGADGWRELPLVRLDFARFVEAADEPPSSVSEMTP